MSPVHEQVEVIYRSWLVIGAGTLENGLCRWGRYFLFGFQMFNHRLNLHDQLVTVSSAAKFIVRDGLK